VKGKPPTTADVLATIARGIPGTSMPAFAFLSEQDRRKIAAYVLDKADLLDGKEPEPLPDPGDGPAVTPELVARGKVVYTEVLQCNTCHGDTGRGDGSTAKLQKDDDGRPVPPRDFAGGVFRGGSSAKDLYYRLTTGMDGSPMPAFADSVKDPDRWALAHFVKSLTAPPAPKPLPADPIEAGREIAAKYSCRGCHVLDDGTGGDVGPDLRVAGQKLDGGWLRAFLENPRDSGHIYPWRAYRMPHLGLSKEEATAMAKYVLAMGERKDEAASLPDTATFDKAKLTLGQSIYGLRCIECHTLGRTIETPLIKQQGPDLALVAGRVDYVWARQWIENPKKIDARTRMTTAGITAEEVDAVRMFVWKASLDEKQKK